MWRAVANRVSLSECLLFLAVGVPVVAGLIGTFLPAFGCLPSLGGHGFTLDPWRMFFASPWFSHSLSLTLFTGIAATAISLAFALCIVLSLQTSAAFERVERTFAPVLASPHVALAIGFAFLIAPSGWIARLLSPWLTGWEVPPDIATVGDRQGIALIVGLALKEISYLVLMTLAALNQIPARAQLAVARSLGYTHAAAWLRIVLPQLLPQLRLPVFAVLAFSLGNVDVALLLGPNNPPPLSVQVLRGYTDYDLKNYFPASAGAVFLLVCVAVCAALYVGVERLLCRALRSLASRGVRSSRSNALVRSGRVVASTISIAALLSLASILIWSFVDQWRFPDKLPFELDVSNWSRLSSQWVQPFVNSLLIGATVTAISAAVVMLALELEPRSNQPARTWLYAPLVVPQIAFLFGVQVLSVRLGIDGLWWTVVWMHIVFALPYLYLSLIEPWRALDPRYARSARALGAPRWRVLLRIKLPLLLRPLSIACAVSFAVSIGQYLATLFAGSGRVATITTEAITLSSGGDRRTLAVYAVLQALLPLLAYAIAYALPAWRFRHRKQMQLTT
jgi:putative thiamine transport system permease protein